MNVLYLVVVAAALVWAAWELVNGIKRERELRRLLNALDVVMAHGIECHCRECRDAHEAMGMPEEALVAIFDKDEQKGGGK